MSIQSFFKNSLSPRSSLLLGAGCMFLVYLLSMTMLAELMTLRGMRLSDTPMVQRNDPNFICEQLKTNGLYYYSVFRIVGWGILALLGVLLSWSGSSRLLKQVFPTIFAPLRSLWSFIGILLPVLSALAVILPISLAMRKKALATLTVLYSLFFLFVLFLAPNQSLLLLLFLGWALLIALLPCQGTGKLTVLSWLPVAIGVAIVSIVSVQTYRIASKMNALSAGYPNSKEYNAQFSKYKLEPDSALGKLFSQLCDTQTTLSTLQCRDPRDPDFTSDAFTAYSDRPLENPLVMQAIMGYAAQQSQAQEGVTKNIDIDPDLDTEAETVVLQPGIVTIGDYWQKIPADTTEKLHQAIDASPAYLLDPPHDDVAMASYFLSNRILANLLSDDMLVAAEKSDWQHVMEDWHQFNRLLDNISAVEPCLFSFLIAQNIEHSRQKVIVSILALLPDEMLQSQQLFAQQRSFRELLIRSLKNEAAIFAAGDSFADPSIDVLFIRKYPLLYSGLFELNQKEVSCNTQQEILQLADMLHNDPNLNEEALFIRLAAVRPTNLWDFLFGGVMNFENCVRILASIEDNQSIIVLANATERYRRKYGTAPTNLELLVPEFLAELPVPRTPERVFTILSIETPIGTAYSFTTLNQLHLLPDWRNAKLTP